MQTILIATKPDDSDSVFVQQALKKYGHEAILWFPSDVPCQQFNTFSISNYDILNWKSRYANSEIITEGINTVWSRRPEKAVFPEDIHPDDKRVIEIENARFFETFWNVIAQNAFWVNHIEAVKKSNSKIRQLEVARNVGLSIPNTILSNDPVEIKNFIRSVNKPVIYKALHSHFWENGDKLKISYTNDITLKQLPSNDILKLTPGLFQERISKLYELRITYFGSYPVAVKLNSQDHDRGKFDWRSIPTGEMKIELVELPDDVHNKCQNLMRHFGLNMGCFDFIVTPEGEYIFLEVNEQGQFLWIEEYNPTIPMLDIFVKFLVNNQYEFDYNSENCIFKINDLRTTVAPIIQSNIENHQPTRMY